MPVLGMAQETGKLISWLKAEGEAVVDGEPIMEIETDKATVEIESTTSGILGGVIAQEGDEVPVGQVIAWILEPGESPPEDVSPSRVARAQKEAGEGAPVVPPRAGAVEITPSASPVAQKMAAEHGIDLVMVKADGSRIQKADVQAYIDSQKGYQKNKYVLTKEQVAEIAAQWAMDIAQRGYEAEGAVRIEG